MWKITLLSVILVVFIALGIWSDIVLFESTDIPLTDIRHGAGSEDDSPLIRPDPIGPEATQERVKIPSSFTPPSKITINGEVINMPDHGLSKHDEPAKDIPIVVKYIYDNRLSRAVNSILVRTDEEGAFNFSIDDPKVRPIRFSFNVRSDEHYRAITKETVIKANVYQSDNLQFHRIPYGGLEGVTVDTHGDPISDVKVNFLRQYRGKDKITAISDSEGKFYIEGVRKPGLAPQVKRDGYTVYDITPLKQREDGGWDQMRITLAPTANLWVHVVGVDGLGIPNRGVTVQPVESRMNKGSKQWGSGFWRSPTDASGTSRFKRAWSGMDLRIGLVTDRETRYADYMNSGQLIFIDEKISGVPIQVPPAGHLELTVVDQKSTIISGTVMYPTHQSASNPTIHAYRVDEPFWELNRWRLKKQGDEKGRYRICIPEDISNGQIHLVAFDESYRFVKNAGERKLSFDHAASVVVHFERTAGNLINQDLILEPALSISGNIVSANGDSLVGEIRAAPAGSDYLLERSPLGLTEKVNSDENGNFQITRLLSGRYDLIFSTNSENVSNTPETFHRFPGIAAGNENVSLVLPNKETVNLRINAYSHSGDIARLVILYGRFVPRKPSMYSTDPTSLIATFQELIHWPKHAPLDNLKSRSEEDITGSYFFSYYQSQKATDYALPPIEEGWHVVGVIGFDNQGRSFFPVATGPVYMEPGDYIFNFHLIPTGTIRGRINPSKEVDRLCVTLKDQKGMNIPVSNGRKIYFSINAYSDGTFIIENAPQGNFTICVNTESNIDTGIHLKEKKVEIKAGANPLIKL